MGDTLRVQSTPNATPTQVGPIPDNASGPRSPTSNQPRRFDPYNETASAVNGGRYANSRGKETPRFETSNYPNVSPHGFQPSRSRHNSTSFLLNNPRQDSFSLPTNYPPGAVTTNIMPQGSTRNAFPGYFPSGRDSILFGMHQGDAPIRTSGESICLPPPLSASRYSEQDPLSNGMSQVAPNGVSGPNASRSTSIFSSLIQLPGSSKNSFSGQSSKDLSKNDLKQKAPGSVRDYSQDYESPNRDGSENMFNWNMSNKSNSPDSKRNTKFFDGQNAFWEQMGNGVSGSIAGLSNDSINALLSNLQNNGSVDFSSMSNEQRRDSIMKFINDQGSKSGRSTLTKTPLREDIFEGQKKNSFYSSEKNNRKEINHVSPTSSMSSKNSKLRDEPQSPKSSPDRPNTHLNVGGSMTIPKGAQSYVQPTNANYAQRPPSAYFNSQQQDPYGYSYQDFSPQYSGQQIRGKRGYSQLQNQQMTPSQQYYHRDPNGGYSTSPANAANPYPNNFKSSQYLAPEVMEQQPNYYSQSNTRPMDTVVDSNKVLVPAQQYARAEDGRPLLGATKVDQLMLVIQAREKGNKTAIKQADDGSILATPNPDHDKNAVLPSTVELVGGIDKPHKEEDGSGDSERDVKRRKRGKTQRCPYCFKEFNQTTHLDVHVRSHIGYKPFQCNFCSKRFTQGGNLRTHMRLHTGEKPFVCEVCSRNFSRKGNLAAHMLTHNKEKPFECKLDDCDKSFTQLGNLKSHQNKFHLPTLTKLTQTFASLTGDSFASLPEDERNLLDYFAKLYKNSNKGIRGRGKGKRVAKLTDGADYSSAPGSTHTSPEQLQMSMVKASPDTVSGAIGIKDNVPLNYPGNTTGY